MAEPEEKQRIKVRAIVEYETTRPADWDASMIDFHLNDSGWCASNFIDELTAYSDAFGDAGCLCAAVQFEYLGKAETPPEPSEATISIKFTPEAAERLCSNDGG